MENGKKNGKEQTQFTSERQPSPEAKSKGWERRRAAQEIMDEMDNIKAMTFEELQAMEKDVEMNPQRYTVLQVKLMQYMKSSKFTVDWLDRHISKAPQQTDITSGGEKIQGLSVMDLKLALGESVRNENIPETTGTE